MHKTGRKIITKAAVAAVATSLLLGGAQVFAAENMQTGDTVMVQLNGDKTKTDYTFVPEMDGDYLFETGYVTNYRMSPKVRIYDGSTLVAEFGSGCSRVVEGMEAGRSYTVQAGEFGLRRNQYGAYDLMVTNLTQIAPDYGMMDVDYLHEDVSPDFGNIDIDFLAEIPVVAEPSVVDETPVSVIPVIDDTQAVPSVTVIEEAPVIVDHSAPVMPAPPAVVNTASASVSGPSRLMMIEGFVNRLYDTALGRSADAEGKAFWMDQIAGGQISASEAAIGFMNSREFLNKDLDDEAFVNVLYTVYFNRVPSAAEAENWVSALENGAARDEVISAFAASSEWGNTCSGFGIA